MQFVLLPVEAHSSSDEPLRISPEPHTRLSERRLLIFSDNGRGILPRKSLRLFSNLIVFVAKLHGAEVVFDKTTYAVCVQVKGHTVGNGMVMVASSIN